MKEINKLFEIPPYSLSEEKKLIFFKEKISKLTYHHYNNSKEYKKLLDFLGFKCKKVTDLKEIPFLPVRLFKEFNLKSISQKKVIKVLLSSGTSNNQPSKIYLDKENANMQSKALNKIVKTILNKERLPMLIIDKNLKTVDRKNFNAQLAAIYGFSIFGRNHTYLLNENNNINYKTLNNFLLKFSNQKFFIFGFTSMVYKNLIQQLSTKLLHANFNNGILLHGGGWKKMEKLKINNKTFKQKLWNKFKLKNVYNYYGLVEQTGSIFLECKCGYFVTSNFSDILIRDKNFNILQNGNKGFIQLFSLLPTSYPGHSILTEDIGEIVEKKNCNCPLNGKRFLVHGRIKEAEIRGCSDT